MDDEDFMYHWNNLKELDPDELVNDLGITSEELLDHFSHRAREYIEKEFG